MKSVIRKVSSVLDENETKEVSTSKLVLVCPFSDSEARVRQMYQEQCFFLTAMGGVFNLKDPDFAHQVNGMIFREGIREILIVGNTSCRFIQRVLNDEPSQKTRPEKELTRLYSENYALINSTPTYSKRAKRLAELNLNEQLLEVLAMPMVGEKILKGKVKLKAILLHKEQNQTKAYHIE